MDVLKNQQCPFCGEKKLTLTEDEQDIPFFGKVYLFSMICGGCGAKKSDVEAAELKEPVKITFETKNEKDMNVRVVKSSEATLRIPQLKMDVSPGTASDGYVTNVEGVLEKFKEILEQVKNDSEDDDGKEKAKTLLKKIWKMKLGDVPVTLVIEDPTGNSAIISEKALVEKLKKK